MAYLVTGLEEFGQDSIQQFKFSGCPHDLLIDSISRRSEILINLGENIGVITDFPQLHQGVLQRGRFSWFTTRSAYALEGEASLPSSHIDRKCLVLLYTLVQFPLQRRHFGIDDLFDLVW